MTTVTVARAEPPTAKPALVTWPLLVRFVSIIGAEVSFYLPLSVLPLYVKATGSDAAAGLASGVLLLATVGAELATPRLAARIGYRRCLAAGLTLLGAPALALVWRASLPEVLAVSIARGIGFAITTVAGGALTASLIPAARRGEGLGLVGVVGGVPALICLPAGLWAADRWGYGPVFVVTAAAALLPLLSLPWLPARRTGSQPAGSVLARLRDPGLARLGAVFSATTVGAGVLVTFLPLAASPAAATMALLASPAASTASRWAAGRIGDRHGQARLLCPALLLAAAGMAALAGTRVPGLVIGGAACFGTGFGMLQNATLAMMYARSPGSAYAAVSAVWNAAYDAGMGAGAAGIGLLAAHAGYSGAFGVTAALILPALAPALRERASLTRPSPAAAGTRRSSPGISAAGRGAASRVR